MAYVAFDTGTPYVFVSPYPDVSASRILVTPAGGSQPICRCGVSCCWPTASAVLFQPMFDPKRRQ